MRNIWKAQILPLFLRLTKEKIEKLITNLNIRKTVQSNDIPTKLVKELGYLFSKYIATSINRCITRGIFVNAFKKAEVWPIYKKDGGTEKSDYRPISVLSNVSKIYERCIYEQMYYYFDKIFSKIQCRFCKGFNTQHILLAMIEKWKHHKIINNFVQLFWLISLRHLIVFVTTC